MRPKLFESSSKTNYSRFVLFLLSLLVLLPVVYSGSVERELYKVQAVVLPKGNAEYDISVDESSYMVFRMKLNTTEDFSEAVSINLLRDHKEYTQRYYIKDANNIYGWARLKPGNYKLVISNSIEKAISVYGYVLLFRNYDPRLPRLVDEKIYGIKNAPVPVGIVDYGVYIDKETDQLVCYRYSTKEVIGIAYINKLDGYSLNPYNRDIKPGELSLQLNLNVKARAPNGKLHTLWIQNIYVLKRHGDALYYRIDDEVHNITVFGRNIVDPNSVKGKGEVTPYKQVQVYQYYDRDWEPVAKPFKPTLLLLHVKLDGNKIYFAHGYFVDENNYFYEVQDEVVLVRYEDLDIVVDGCSYMGKPINMELVIGGRDHYYRLFVANEIDMRLALLIKNNTWVSPPSTWTIGTSSAEKTYNVASELDQPIVARLVKGVSEVEQLWSKHVSSKFSLPQLELCIVRFSNGTSSIRVMPTSGLEGFRIEGIYKVGPLSITLMQEEKLGSITSYYRYIVFGVVVLVVVVVSAILLRRKKKKLKKVSKRRKS